MFNSSETGQPTRITFLFIMPSLMLTTFPITLANKLCCQPARLSTRSSVYPLREPLYYLQSDHLCVFFCRILCNGTIGKNWKRVGKDSSRSFNMALWPEKQLRKWLPMRQQEVEPQSAYCALK